MIDILAGVGLCGLAFAVLVLVWPSRSTTIRGVRPYNDPYTGLRDYAVTDDEANHGRA